MYSGVWVCTIYVISNCNPLPRYSGYALFMDDPVNPGVKVPINHNSKLCDVIAKWETNTKPNNYQVSTDKNLYVPHFLHEIMYEICSGVT